MPSDADRLLYYAEQLLASQWGMPKTPSPSFLTVLQRILDEQKPTRTAPLYLTLDTAPVPVPDQEEDDLDTIQRWMDEGEWLR